MASYLLLSPINFHIASVLIGVVELLLWSVQSWVNIDLVKG